MIRSAIKLVYIALVPLGGLFAGWMHQYVKHPEIYAFFCLFGVAISLLGAFGFAREEADEAVTSERARQGWKG